MSRRPTIPQKVRRIVLLEAGYRCAIPTCRTPLTEAAHIVSWRESHNNDAYNLIALCPNCHTRYDRGDIPREALAEYKRKLIYLNDVYSRFEIDVLDYLKTHNRVLVPCEILVKRLLEEGLIEVETVAADHTFDDGESIPFLFSVMLTESGRQLVEEWNQIGVYSVGERSSGDASRGRSPGAR